MIESTLKRPALKKSMRKHIIDPDKLSETFQLPYEHPGLEICETDEIINRDKQLYNFHLNEEGRETSMELVFDEDNPREVSLYIELRNGYESHFRFDNITHVEYIPKYRTVVLERQVGDRKDKLKILWRGQFDLL